MKSPPMEIPTHRTKSALAYERLRSEIVSALICPGERIIVQNIARRYGISEIPVREALQRLEADGFVQNTPYVGATVTMPDFENQEELFEVREILEGRAVELAAHKLSPTQLEDLEHILEKMEQVLTNDMKKYSKLNDQFHEKIYAASGNKILQKFIERAWSMSPRTRSIFYLIPDAAQLSFQQHKEILACLKEKDASGAREAMQRHKGEGFRLLSNIMKTLQKEISG